VLVTVNATVVTSPWVTEAAPKALSSAGLASETRMLSKAWSLPFPDGWALRRRTPNCDPESRTEPLGRDPAADHVVA